MKRSDERVGMERMVLARAAEEACRKSTMRPGKNHNTFVRELR